MDGINRKKMQDMIIPQTQIMRRPDTAPAFSSSPVQTEVNERIEKSSFFKKIQKEGDTPKTPSKSGSHFLIIFLSTLSVLVLGFLIANYFSSARISVVPFTHRAHIDNEIIAVSELGAEDESLSFQFMSLSEDESIDVPATIEKKIQKKASGKVIIYNVYNSQSQRLIKNTRLESSDKKIFRIDGSVVVPGAKIVGGKVVESGSVEALVYADAPGETYNIGLADFTIPGFKGDPRYTKFTARSRADSPIRGGFSGTIKVAPDEDIARAQADLKERLKRTAVEKIRTQIPGGTSFFPGSMVLKFEEVEQGVSVETNTKVTMRAIISVFFFDTEILTRKIAKLSLDDYQGESLSLSNISTVLFTFVEPVDKVVLSDLKHIRFRLEGDPVFIGNIDTPRLIDSLAGKEKKDFAKIITTQKNIKKADATIFPLWKTVFPVEREKFSVKIISE